MPTRERATRLALLTGAAKARRETASPLLRRVRRMPSGPFERAFSVEHGAWTGQEIPYESQPGYRIPRSKRTMPQRWTRRRVEREYKSPVLFDATARAKWSCSFCSSGITKSSFILFALISYVATRLRHKQHLGVLRTRCFSRRK